MQFTTLTTSLLSLLSLVSLLSLASAYRNPPYCTNTGPGVCNLGWEYDWDLSKFHIWVYDRNCNQLGQKDNVGYLWELIPNKLPQELRVWNNAKGPNFQYGTTRYSRNDCWYMQGPTAWQYAGQCAFLCEAPGDGTGGGENNLSGRREIAGAVKNGSLHGSEGH
jgi:hypothetical protein